MEVDRYERIWMTGSAIFVLSAVIAVVSSVVFHTAELPEPAGRIEPELVTQTAPFDEPGLHQRDDGSWELIYVGQVWAWTPQQVTIPAEARGEEITIKAASIDVIHGMKITDTNVNVMLIPGHVSEVAVTFDEPGSHTLVCHEYCGIQHHLMGAEIVVE